MAMITPRIPHRLPVSQVAARSALLLGMVHSTMLAEDATQAQKPEKMTPFEVASQSLKLAAPDEVDTAHMSSYEVFTTAGTAADVNRAIQLLPGVPSIDEGNTIFVKGGASSETTYYVNDVPFPSSHQKLSPVGSFQSGLKPNYLRKIDFYTGNTPVKFDTVLSGVVNLQTIRATPDVQRTVDVGLSSIFGLLEVPLGKGAGFAIGAGITDTELLYRVNSAPVKYTVEPKGREVFANSSIEGKAVFIEVVLFAQQNQVGIIAQSNNFSGPYAEKTSTVFGALRAKGSLGSWDWKAVAGGGKESSRESLGVLDFKNAVTTGYIGLEVTRDVTEKLTFGAGANFAPERGKLRGFAPTTDALDAGAPKLELNFDAETSSTGLFTSMNWHPLRKLEIVPGLRFERFGEPNRARIEPRISINAPIKKGFSAQFFIGRISKGPTATDLVSAPNPLSITDLNEASTSISLSRPKWALSLGAFHKTYSGINQFNNNHLAVGYGRGSSRGAWGGGTWKATKALRFTGSYTWADSERTNPQNYNVIGASSFDVRNTAAVHGDYLYKSYTFSILGKAASGKPFTPITGAAYVPASDIYLPRYGPYHGARLPSTYRIDMSFSRFDLIGKIPMVSYVSINNVTNHRNVFGYAYSNDYSVRQPTGRLFPRTIYAGTSIKY